MVFRKFGSPDKIIPIERDQPDDQGIRVTAADQSVAPMDAEEILREGEDERE